MNRGAVGWACADLRRRWAGLLVIAVLTGLSAAVVMVAVLGARRTESALPRALAATGTSDVSLQYTDPAITDAVLGAPQVADGATASLYVGGTEGVGVDLSALVGDAGYGSMFERIVIQQGRLAEPAAAHEVVVPPATAEAIGVTVGDSFIYDTLSPKQLEGFVTGQPPDESVAPGPSIELTVVGIGATMPELVDATPGIFFATPAFDAAYADEVGHFGDELGGLARVRLAGGADDVDAYVAAVLASPGSDRWGDEIIFEPLTDITDRAAGALSTLSTGAYVFTVVAGLAGLAAVGLSVARHVQRSADDQDTLMALGLTRVDRAVASALAVAPAVLGAVIVAVAGAILASALTPFGTARTFELQPGLVVDAPVLLVGAAAAVVAIGITAAIAAWTTAGASNGRRRHRPAATTAVAAAVGSGARLATGVSLAFEHGRGAGPLVSRSAIVGGTLAVAGLTGGLMYTTNLDALVDQPERWGWTWDVMVEFDDQQTALDALDGLPEVADLTLVADRQLVIEGRSARGQTHDVHKGTGPVVVQAGRAPTGPDEIALGPALLRDLDLQLGDSVQVDDGDGARPLTLVGRATLYPLDDQALGTDALLASADLDETASSDGANNILIGGTSGTSTDELLAALEPLDGDIITLSAYSLPQTPSEVVNASSLRPLPWALATFLVLLGVSAIAHAVHATLRRRRHDLAVLRAMGFRPADVRAAIRWQATCIAVVALIIGVPIGLIGGRLLFEALAEDMGLNSSFTTSALLVAVAALSMLVALQLVGVALGLRAARQRPAVILRTE